MVRVEKVYRYVRLLSIDVALAALGAGVMATRIVGSHPSPLYFVLLPLAVWIVYTLDHLLDARRLGNRARLWRHRFHHQHATMLWCVCVFASIACACLAVRALTWTGLMFETIVGLLFLVHELFVKLTTGKNSPMLTKEIAVAFIFTLGTWGLPIVRCVAEHLPIGRWVWLALGQYFLLAVVNLMEFAWFEARSDERDHHSSFVLGVGRPIAGRITFILLALQLPLCVIGVIARRSQIALVTEGVFLTMTAGLAVILLRPRAFVRRERYRTLGDGVFLLPLLTAWL